MKIGDFIPPILLRLRKKSSIKEYDSYNSALEDSNTYEDPAIIEVVASKTKSYKESLTSNARQYIDIDFQTAQNMFVISYIHSDRSIGVLELGGACGASYYELSHFLPGMIGHWFVVETRAMAAAGRKLFHDDRIKFFSQLEVAASGLENRAGCRNPARRALRRR